MSLGVGLQLSKRCLSVSSLCQSAATCRSLPAEASRKKNDLKQKMKQLKHIPDFPWVFFLKFSFFNKLISFITFYDNS